MPEWMLTDKERLAISIVLYQSAEYQEHCYLPPDDFYKAIAKAQARKLIERLGQLCITPNHIQCGLRRGCCPECMEQLMKEVQG